MKQYTKQEVSSFIKDKKLTVLLQIYKMRHLNYNQILQITYLGKSTNLSQEKKATSRLINELIKYKCIEEVMLGDLKVYNLLSRSIEILLDFGYLKKEVYDDKKKIARLGYNRAYQLKMSPMILPHQLQLNQFVLDFQDRVQELNPLLEYEYLDEQDITKTYMFESDRIDKKRPNNVEYNMKPDGMIRLKNLDIIIEMDMGTETTPLLQKKWVKYKNYFNSSKNQGRTKPFLVLFVLGKTRTNAATSYANRKKIVWQTMYDRKYELTREYFDIAVGEHHEMLDYLTSRAITGEYDKELMTLKELLQNRFSSKILSPENIVQRVNPKHHYDFLITQQNEEGKDLVADGRIQSFFVNYLPVDSLKVITNIFDHYLFQEKLTTIYSEAFIQSMEEKGLDRNQQHIQLTRYKRRIEVFQVIVVSDIQKAFLQSKMADLHTSYQVADRRSKGLATGVYYTTINQLKNAPTFYEALLEFKGEDLIEVLADATLTKSKKTLKLNW